MQIIKKGRYSKITSPNRLPHLAGFLVLLPDRQPFFPKEAELNQIMVLPFPKDVLAPDAVRPITAFQAVLDRRLVVGDDFGAHLTQIEHIKDVVQEMHLGIDAVFLALILPFADEGPRGADAVPPVDVMNTHHTN